MFKRLIYKESGQGHGKIKIDGRKTNEGTLLWFGEKYLMIILLGVYTLLTWTPLSYTQAYAHDNPGKKVLVLNSYHRTFKWTDKIVQGIRSVLETEKQDVEIYVEDMDSKRFSSKEYIRELEKIYALKFSGLKFDVIISSDDNAFHFLLRHQNDLFPDTPVVFCGVNHFKDSMLKGHKLFTGVVEVTDIKSNIELILKLHPETKSIAVITDNTTTGEGTRKILEQASRDYSGIVEIISLDGSKITRAGLLKRLQALPKGSPALLLNFHQDKSNQFIPYNKFIPILSANMKSPLYCASDNFLGYGPVGGELNSAFHQGEAAGKMARLILQGEDVADIPVLKKGPNRYMFDYKQMQRFGIKLSDLPEGSIVINRPSSFYTDHKDVFWIVTATIFTLTFIILVLLFNINSRKRTEKDLEESKERLSLALKVSNSGIWDFNPRTLADIHLSDSWFSMLGYAPDEITVTAEKWVKLIHPDDGERIQERFRGHLEKRTPYDVEFRIKKKDDDYLWVRSVGKVVSWDNSGNPSRMLGIHVNINDRKKSEETLKRSEASLAAAQQIAHLGSWDYDVVNDDLLWSEEIYRIFGLAPEEFGGSYEAFLNSVHPDDREFVEKSVDRALNAKIPYEIDHRIILPTGEERIVHEMAEVIFDETGRPLRMIGTVQDITGRVRSERKVLQSEERLLSVFDGISDPLIMVDKNMKVLLQNRAAMKYYGASSAANYLNRECYEVFNGTSSPCEGCGIPSAISTGRHESFERKGFMDPERLEQIVMYPINHKDHQDGAAIIRISDVTRERQMEKELIQADRMISLGVLVSGIAHEINNPNNFIMLNAPLLREAWDDIAPLLEGYYEENGDFSMGGLPYSEMRDEIPQLFSGIKEGSDRIQRIVRDLKDYARKDGADMDQSVNINEVIKSAIRMTGNMIKKVTKNFRIEYGRNLPPFRGNKQKLEQVMINLIQNACQSLPDKEKGVFVTSTFDREGGGVRVEVRDEGEGIPEKLLPRIMDPFFTTRRDEGGTGLGLSVSSNIVKGHGGRIEVESEWGEGTVFRIFIPTTRIEEPAKILVADDDRDIRELLHTALGEVERYIVREASNGAEAFLKIGREPPDLLILDVQMPDMDGVEVCRLIRENPELSAIKVIVITGFPNSSGTKAIARMGFDKILAKPFSIPALLKMVGEVLEV